MGANPGYEALADELGTKIAAADMGLVYGAGSVGLMGVVARAARDAGAPVIGIIPEHLDAVEITQEGLAELHVTKNMHERKKMMFDRSDAFIVLPGGLGTLDETFEIMTWAQLSLHRKPILLLNHKGYWDPLITLVSHVVAEGFASPENARLLQTVEGADDAIAVLSRADTPDGGSKSALF
jgi:uncharacterized protein (TIGR00730 family)